MLFFQHRPLFDVGFDVAEQSPGIKPRPPQSGRLSPELADGISHRNARGVLPAQIGLVEYPGGDAASEAGALVTNALLIGEGGDFNGKGKADALPVQMLDARNSEEYAQCAVECAGVAHRVQMRAEQEDFRVRFWRRLWVLDFGFWALDVRLWTFRGVVAEQVANGIFAHGHSRLAHPPAGQIVGTAHGGGAKAAEDSRTPRR